MVEFVAALSATELVRINVLDERHERHVQGLLHGRVDTDNVRFHRFPTNDAWCRDHGAIFVVRDDRTGKTLLALDFEFNSWGGKYPPYDADNAIPPQMAQALDVPCLGVDMVLECTGAFSDRATAELHLAQGGARVLFSQPAEADVDGRVHLSIRVQEDRKGGRIRPRGRHGVRCVCR